VSAGVSAGVAHGAGAQAGALARHAPVLLVWSCLLLLPFGRAVEVPVLLMAAAGIGLVVRERTRLLASPATRTFVFVFAAMWLPMALSLPDAVHPQRTALVVANHLRFLLGGLFICHALAAPGARERLLALAGALLALWVLDGGVQWLLGVDLLGQASAGGRISGPFGDDSRKLGTTFAVLAPLLWVCAQRRFPAWVLVVAVLASAWLVMGAGSRAAWVTLLVAAAGFAWASRARLRSLGTRVVLAAVLLAALLPAAVYLAVPAFEARLDETLRELSGAEPIESSPLGHRGYIWRGALAMIAEHPLNGVGARGFRYAFPRHAVPGDPFVEQVPPVYPTHSHQLLLEIAAETGAAGIAGLLAALALLVRAGLRAGPRARACLLPYAIALGAAFFPLNTHHAVYSAYFSQIAWWLVAVFCACLAGGAREPGAGA